MALTDAQWSTIEQRSGVPRHVMQVLLNKGERSAQSSVSPAGAFGRAQLMPATAASLSRQYGVNPNTEFGNVLLGAMYLGSQKRTFGNWKLAFAAYNAGGRAVKRYGGVPPFKETQDYVRRTMAALGQGGGAQPPQTPGVPAQPLPAKVNQRLQVQPLPVAQFARQQMQQFAEGGEFDPMALQQEIVQTMRSQRPVAVGQNPQGRPVPITKQGGPMTVLDRKALNLVQGAMGTPYVWGGSKPGGFDCSGLLQWAWGKVGVSIPRTTYQQWSAGTPVGRGQLRAGDAVFFRGSDARGNLPGHVGMYIGNGKFIEAPHTGAVVRISKLAGRTDFQGARRFA